MPDTPSTLSPEALYEQLTADSELALLDVREELDFAAGHILYASCLPLSRLELLLAQAVVRRDTPVVVCDGGEGLAARAAVRMTELGYTQARVLLGGTPAWAAAGYELFSGVNVPSKAFGEHVEVGHHTPSVAAEELGRWLQEGRDLVVLDARPFDEYHARSIPSGFCVPGAELAYRVHDLAPDPSTTVVVNCAGRTRSIIGAQSLINAGIANPVVALRNGTMGWHLAGLEVARGQTRRPVGRPSPQGLECAQAAARQVAHRFEVKTIDHAGLACWRADSTRSLYLLDVRQPEEYEAGHLPGARSAPGGQLVQETDKFLPTQRARVVLVDDTMVRSVMTASWLNQMGWSEVAALEAPLIGVELETGPEPPRVLGLGEAQPVTASAAEVERWWRAGQVTIIDLSLSRNYGLAHIAGAKFARRCELAEVWHGLGERQKDRLVLTSEDGALARIAAVQMSEETDTEVYALEGGNRRWVAAGFTLTHQEPVFLSVPKDIWKRPYESDEAVEQSMQAYLDWEVALVSQLERDGTTRFWAPR